MTIRNALITLTLACSFLVCCFAPTEAFGQEVETLAQTREASTFDELKSYLDEFATTADDMTIQVSASFAVTELLVIPANSSDKTLTITSANSSSVQTLTRHKDYQDNLFELQGGARVIFTHVIVNGNKNNIDEAKAMGSLVFAKEGSELTLEEGAEFRNNRSSESAGGIYCMGRFVMHGGTIAGNEVARSKDTFGGGILVIGDNASFYFDGGMVGGYTEECANQAVSGGGICVVGNDNDTRQDAYVITGNAQIIGNIAGWDYDEDGNYPQVFGKGGGVFHEFGTLLMSGGTIARNSALGPTSTGGGVENYYGRFVMTGGIIGGNSIEDANIAGKGGGICSEASNMDALELGGTARIAFNIAGRQINGVWNEGFGGGVLLAGIPSSGTLSSASIENNEARGENNWGSGIFVMEEATLYIKGAPSLSANTIFTENTLAESLVLLENLTGGSLIIQGSYQDGQMLEGVVAASSAGFAVNALTASAFVSADKRLVGMAQGNTVVWALAHPKPLPPTNDGAAGMLLVVISLLFVVTFAGGVLLNGKKKQRKSVYTSSNQ